MKKVIFTLILAAFTVCGFSQNKYYTVDAQVVESSIKAYSHTVADSAVVDSVTMQVNCWFGQVGNTYIKKDGGQWQFCAFNQIKVTMKGNPKSSYYLNAVKKYADIYRQKTYPDTK